MNRKDLLNCLNFHLLKIALLASCACFLVFNHDAHAKFPRFLSLIKSGADLPEFALGVGVDGATNAYLLGSFGSLTTIGGTTLTNTSGYPSIFVAKYSYTGLPSAVPWARTPIIDYPLSNTRIAVDSLGYSYIAGNFGGTNLTFGTNTLTNLGDPSTHSEDVFLVKYDTLGKVAWLKQAGGTGQDTLTQMVQDNVTGSGFITGWFRSQTFSFGTTNLARQSIDSSDCFVIKYSGSGNVIWARRGSNAAGNLLASDGFGNCYVGGVILGATVFDGLTPTNQTTDKFFIKYNVTGTPLWMRGDMNTGSHLAADRAQNIFTAGTFSGVAQFGSISLTNDSPATIFLAKYDSTGNPLWARQLPGFGNDCVTGIGMDTFTNCWITGYFSSAEPASPGTNLFVACFDPTGRLLGVTVAGGATASMAAGIGDYQGRYNYVCGSFATNFSFGGLSVTNNGDTDILLGRLSLASPLIRTTVTNNNIVLGWPSGMTGYTVEAADDLSSTNWAALTNAPVIRSGQYVITNQLSDDVRFYRLRQ